ncbi:hypothetical protein ACFW04_006544 [Cataglyphis niger]
MGILEIYWGGGVEGKVIVIGQREGFRIDEEESISRSEIRAVIGRLKDNKAVGTDGIPAEVWKYGGENMEEWIWKICNRVYASVLAGKLSEEVEEKGLVPQNQTGFRKGLGTMDNIFILNYLVNRQLSKKKGKLIAFFIDLKAAFDSVDRRKLVEAMRERGVREGLIRRSEDIMREIRNSVRRGKDLGTEFWTGRGVRQGCPLNPHLFNLITADIEEVMSRGGWGS